MPITTIPNVVRVISSPAEPVHVLQPDQRQMEEVVEVGERINKHLEQITNLELEPGDLE